MSQTKNTAEAMMATSAEAEITARNRRKAAPLPRFRRLRISGSPPGSFGE